MNLQSHRLPPDKEDVLREWLNHPGFNICIEVLKSDAFKERVEASNFRALPDTKGAAENAPIHEQAALLIEGAAASLQAFKETPVTEPFTTYTAIP